METYLLAFDHCADFDSISYEDLLTVNAEGLKTFIYIWNPSLTDWVKQRA